MSHYLEAKRFSTEKQPRIIRFFPDTDLRSGHLGLRAVAKDHNIDISKLRTGEFLAFSNRSQTDMKIYAPGNVLVHVKSPQGRLDLRVVKLIPTFFNGQEFNYPAALERVLKERMKIND